MIDRKSFVQLCTQLIEKTRDHITPVNQVSGYLKYHREIKSRYLDTVREFTIELIKSEGPSLQGYHDKFQHTKVGNCGELSLYLAAEILNHLKSLGVDAEVTAVKSKTYDHQYVQVVIKLENEKTSTWEVDAWHPRIIDRSVRPDGSIKNSEALLYGTETQLIIFALSSIYDITPPRSAFFEKVRPAIPGIPRDATPPHEVEKKNHLYPDYSIEQAHYYRELDNFHHPYTELGYLRKVSSWQKEEKPSKKRKDHPEKEKTSEGRKYGRY
ncbi:MAG TPA: hypothetical protein VHM20_04065 [Gammaproteobacteria bacterium]|jgi:hypothetical protein|nr:hypothetical protein [Gammaproteobacteria bacterium]